MSVIGVIMNKTKFWLILFAIVFSFISVGFDIYSIVVFFLYNMQKVKPIFYLVFYFIEIFAQIVVAVLLILAIWNKGKHFRARYGYYMTSLVISLIISLFSISSILLIISMFVSDWVWVKPKNDEFENNGKIINISDTREEKIAKLRRKRENGEMTEEEFQQEIMKLL